MPGITKPPSKPGSTGKRICLAGDSAGGNLCFTVSLRAAAYGVRVPDGIMAAYPATMLQSTASPSRLMSLMDPLLPLSVLCKCVSAYAGGETEDHSDSDQKALGMMGLVRRDTALLFRDLRLSASSWLNSFLELSGHKSHLKSVSMGGECGPPSGTHPGCPGESTWHTTSPGAGKGPCPGAFREAKISFLVLPHIYPWSLSQSLDFLRQSTSWKFRDFWSPSSSQSQEL